MLQWAVRNYFSSILWKTVACHL